MTRLQTVILFYKGILDKTTVTLLCKGRLDKATNSYTVVKGHTRQGYSYTVL